MKEIDEKIIRYVTKSIRHKEEILKIAITKNVLNYRFISKELLSNDEFLFSILSAKPTVYSFFPYRIRCRRNYFKIY